MIIINTYLLSGAENNQLYVADTLTGLLNQPRVSRYKPCIAVGHHGVDCLAQADQNNVWMLLDDLGVDLYLCGHSHRLGCVTNEMTQNKIRQSTVGGLISNHYTDISFSTITLEGAQCTLQYYTYVKGMWQEQPGGNVAFFPPRLKPVYKLSVRDSMQYSIMYSMPKPAGEEENTAMQSYPRAPELDQIENLFILSDIRLSYFTIIASWIWEHNEYSYGDVHVERNRERFYKVPDEFIIHWKELEKSKNITIGKFNANVQQVRLDHYSFDCSRDSELTLFVSPISYGDFLMTSNHLDYPITQNSEYTFRDKYFSDTSSFIKPELSCLCGVGVFIITADNKIIIRQSSDYVTVAPTMFSYAASGSMDWSDDLHPFDEICRECMEEIGYELNPNDLFLFSFGMDYNQAYFQFSFYERSSFTAARIINNAMFADDFSKEIRRLIPLDFTIESVVDIVRKNQWEPSAAAALLTLLAKEYSKERVETYINPHLKEEEYRTSMPHKWDQRARRKGKAAAFSNRLPRFEVDHIAETFINEVYAFIKDDLNERSILEVGCGIGLMTKRLAESARSVYCVDLSELMIERNKKYLGGELIKKVEYSHCFFQDFQGRGPYDLLISMQMLMHNKEDFAFKAITEKMKAMSDTIFLFEQIDTGIQTSFQTKARSFEEYVSCFPEYQAEKLDTDRYLFTDQYMFIKLVRMK